jgi:hypothetical protein
MRADRFLTRDSDFGLPPSRQQGNSVLIPD